MTDDVETTVVLVLSTNLHTQVQNLSESSEQRDSTALRPAVAVQGLCPPEHALILFLRDTGQARVSKPADARISVIIDDAVEGAIDAIANIIVHDFVAAGILAHTRPIDVQQQTG